MSSIQSQPETKKLRSGANIYPSHDKAIERHLAELLERTPAHFILLTDVSGQVVSSRGDRGNINLVGLGSLVAGDLAASREIARISGVYEDYQMILREGSNLNTFISEAGDYLVLLVQVASDVPLGWARMLIQASAEKIGIAMNQPPEPGEEIPKLDFGDTQLADVIGDALDELWKG